MANHILKPLNLSDIVNLILGQEKAPDALQAGKRPADKLECQIINPVLAEIHIGKEFVNGEKLSLDSVQSAKKHLRMTWLIAPQVVPAGLLEKLQAAINMLMELEPVLVMLDKNVEVAKVPDFPLELVQTGITNLDNLCWQLNLLQCLSPCLGRIKSEDYIIVFAYLSRI